MKSTGKYIKKIHYLNPVAKYCKLRDAKLSKGFNDYLWYYTCGLMSSENYSITEDFNKVTCLKCRKDEYLRRIGYWAGRGYKCHYIKPPNGLLWIDRKQYIK